MMCVYIYGWCHQVCFVIDQWCDSISAAIIATPHHPHQPPPPPLPPSLAGPASALVLFALMHLYLNSWFARKNDKTLCVWVCDNNKCCTNTHNILCMFSLSILSSETSNSIFLIEMLIHVGYVYKMGIN